MVYNAVEKLTAELIQKGLDQIVEKVFFPYFTLQELFLPNRFLTFSR